MINSNLKTKNNLNTKSNLIQKLNTFLNNQKLSKEEFDDLKHIAEITNFNEKILKWFRFLQNIEIVGWRPKQVSKTICNILTNNKDIEIYALFCPSYLKGDNVYGFRTDDVGETTKYGLKMLNYISNKTQELGFKIKKTSAIFFDLALEQSEKSINKLNDLKINIENFKKYIPNNIKFSLLSERFPELIDIIGYKGIEINPLPISSTTLNRIIERGEKFYERFNWSKEQITERSKIIASSENIVGTFIRYNMPNSIMVYTPTMLERAQIYSGYKFETDPLAIIFPKRDLEI